MNQKFDVKYLYDISERILLSCVRNNYLQSDKQETV